MATLEIFFLGDYRILWNKSPLKPFPTKKTRGLFAYLVTHRKRSHTRTQLAGVFWPDYPEDRALRNLSTTLWRIRQVIPEGYIKVEGERIGFITNSQYWLDFQEFERLCLNSSGPGHLAALEKAVDLYQGDFLAGWYQDWSLIEVEKLRSMYIQALFELMVNFQEQGHSKNALEFGLKILLADPLREDVHFLVVKLYAVLGHRQAALQQFENCKNLLQQELGLDPTPEMIALVDQIQLMPTEAARQIPDLDLGKTKPATRTSFDDFDRLPLIGRNVERTELLGYLDKLNHNAGDIVLLEGEPGIGKTRLMEEIAAGAEWRGMQVLWGHCGKEPYQPFVEALSKALTPLRISQISRIINSNLIDPLLKLFPELAAEFPLQHDHQVEADIEKEQLFRALTACLIALNQISPHVFVLENWHLMDSETVELLPRLAEQISDARLLILGTARGGELRENQFIWQRLLELDRAGSLSRLCLDHLSLDESLRLVESLLGQGQAKREIINKVYDQTKGNPLFILETLKDLFETDQIVRDKQGLWQLGRDEGFVLPQAIQEVILSRLDKLSADERMLLEIASTLSDSFDYDLWRLAAGWDDDQILICSSSLLQHQWLVEVPEGYRFGHDLIKQVTYEQIDTSRRCQFHHQAGLSLSQCYPEQVGELARHFFLADDFRRALEYAQLAGQRAERFYASASAIDFYSRAIHCAQEIGGESGSTALIQAAERRGRAYEILGDYQQALEDFEIMYKAAENMGDIKNMAKATRLIGWNIGNRMGDRQKGFEKSNLALELALQADDRQLVAIIYRDLGSYHNMMGEYRQSIDALHAALEIFRELGDLEGEAACLQFMAVGFHFISRYDQSLSHYQQALALWNELGEKVKSANTLCDIGYLCLSQGEVSLALDSLEESLRIFQEIGALGYLPWALLGIGALFRYQLKGSESLRCLSQAVNYGKEAKKTSPYVSSLIALHRGMAYWGLGQLERSFECLASALELAHQSDIPTLVVGALVDFGRCLRQVGEFDRAVAFHQEALSLACQVDFQDGIIRAKSELGLGLAAQGEVTKGLQLLNDAMALSKDGTSWEIAEVSINRAEAYFLNEEFELALTDAQYGFDIAAEKKLGELAAWGHLILGSIFAAQNRQNESTEALEGGLQLLEDDCVSVLKFRLLAVFSMLARSQGESSQYIHQLQEFVDQLSADIQDADFRHTVLEEIRRIINASKIDLEVPGYGQIIAIVRCAESTQGSQDSKRIMWTQDAGPPDTLLLEQAGKVALRRHRLVRLLDEAIRQGADPTTDELASVLKVSGRTIRNDLRTLQENGEIDFSIFYRTSKK